MTPQNLLAQRALLCTLNTGAWRATKQHRAETDKVNADHATKDVSRCLVSLTNHPALGALLRLHAAARARHYEITLPSVDANIRLLPCGRELQHSEMMAEFAVKHEALVRELLGVYDLIRAEAPARMKGFYNVKHWPADISDKFRFVTRYLPVPDVGTWQEWMAESAKAGADDLKDRIGECVRRFMEKLKDPKAIFRDTLVENLRDICSLSDLNLSGDVNIGALFASSADLVRSYSPEQLRNDPASRRDAAERAANICKNFNL